MLLSPTTFWDMDISSLSLEKNKKLIIERIFQKGTLDEIIAILRHCSREDCKNALLDARYLDKKTLSF